MDFSIQNKKRGNVHQNHRGMDNRFNAINDLTKYSRVNSMSKIDFAPAHTTATGVLPSSVRSALMSNAVKHNKTLLK